MTVAPYDPEALPRRVLVEYPAGTATIRKPGVLERVEQPAPVAWVRMDDGPTEFVALERVVEWPDGYEPGRDAPAAMQGEPGDGEIPDREPVMVDVVAEPMPPHIAKLAAAFCVGDAK